MKNQFSNLKNFMKFCLISIIFFANSINCFSLGADEIRVFYNKKILTFQKNENKLYVSVNKIFHKRNNDITYQYINSYFKDDYYYFMFLATASWLEFSRFIGFNNEGGTDAVILIKIDANFENYNLKFQHVYHYDISTLLYTMPDGFKNQGQLFLWRVEEYLHKCYDVKYIGINAGRLEDGFFIYRPYYVEGLSEGAPDQYNKLRLSVY
jgi:hypothetical protein